MKFTNPRMFAAVGMIAALTIASPVFAQSDRRGSNSRQGSQSTRQAAPRETSHQAAPPPQAARQQAPVRQEQSARPQPQARTQPVRPQASVRPGPSGRPEISSSPRQSVAPGRAVVPGQAYAVPRSSVSRPTYSNGPGYSSANRFDGRFNDRRTVIVAPRFSTWGGFRVGFGAPRQIVRFYEPYYSFQPRFRLGLGLSIGYPVAYPVWYDPYPAYGYALGVGARYGGMSFDIQPEDAAVFVDGAYMGVVEDFSPYEAPLTLRAGLHRIELRAQDCQPMAFDITIVPGQVIPYSGTLAYGR